MLPSRPDRVGAPALGHAAVVRRGPVDEVVLEPPDDGDPSGTSPTEIALGGRRRWLVPAAAVVTALVAAAVVSTALGDDPSEPAPSTTSAAASSVPATTVPALIDAAAPPPVTVPVDAFVPQPDGSLTFSSEGVQQVLQVGSGKVIDAVAGEGFVIGLDDGHQARRWAPGERGVGTAGGDLVVPDREPTRVWVISGDGRFVRGVGLDHMSELDGTASLRVPGGAAVGGAGGGIVLDLGDRLDLWDPFGRVPMRTIGFGPFVAGTTSSVAWRDGDAIVVSSVEGVGSQSADGTRVVIGQPVLPGARFLPSGRVLVVAVRDLDGSIGIVAIAASGAERVASGLAEPVAIGWRSVDTGTMIELLDGSGRSTSVGPVDG